MAGVESYKTVSRETVVRFVEKKSEFITSVSPTGTEEEAKAFIEKIRALYPDATHNVFAYVNREGNASRFSDDGEPQGTAGMPVFEVIRREELRGVCIVVTRYFGGILLGAGGLVRAYSRGASDAVREAGITVFTKKSVLKISVDYDSSGRILRELEKLPVTLLEKNYSEKVEAVFTCGADDLGRVRSALADASAGKCVPEVIGERFSA
ncbi:MAG: YigZ family protein [Clostridia bacterium]|nr:YigZ family protein [Clostridia bacterium]